jgi:hypothetical protein
MALVQIRDLATGRGFAVTADRLEAVPSGLVAAAVKLVRDKPREVVIF